MYIFLSFMTAILWLTVTSSFSEVSPLGHVIGWGCNNAGEATGVPTSPVSNRMGLILHTPQAAGRVTLSGKVLTNISAVAAGWGFSLALREDGAVMAWGTDQNGLRRLNEIPTRFLTNGQVFVSGQPLTNVYSLACGDRFGMALKKDGNVVVWGKTDDSLGLSNIIAIAAKENYCDAVKNDGTVLEWHLDKSQSKDYGVIHEVQGLSNAIAVAVGSWGNVRRKAALKSDGTVFTWGTQTTFKDATPPAGLTNVTAIAVGFNHSLALLKNGTVMGWGFNENGQATGVPTEKEPSLTNGLVTINGMVLSNIVAIAANDGYSLALKKEGTVVGWGRDCPKIPAGLKDVFSISAGMGYCLAITTNQAVAESFAQSK